MDLLLQENGDGGELVKTPRDLTVIEGLQNMVYLALMGGNVEASTPTERLANVEDFSYWGNTFLSPASQFNSETQRALRLNPVTSAGRINIENAVKADLKHMQDFSDVTPSVSITSTDRIRIQVDLKQPENQQDKQFVFIWDATKNELITEQ